MLPLLLTGWFYFGWAWDHWAARLPFFFYKVDDLFGPVVKEIPGCFPFGHDVI